MVFEFASITKSWLFIFLVSIVCGILFAVIFSGVLYGIQNNNADQKLKYGNFFSIIIIPSIYLGLLAGIILL
jgi:Na+-transporting NADH:ubiquinone oxidoreductase subunit NqrC